MLLNSVGNTSGQSNAKLQVIDDYLLPDQHILRKERENPSLYGQRPGHLGLKARTISRQETDQSSEMRHGEGTEDECLHPMTFRF